MSPLGIGPTRMKYPTRFEVAVIVWGAIILFGATGIVSLWHAFRAPPEKAELAGELKLYGFGFLAGSVAIWLGYRGTLWLYHRYL